MGKRIVGYVISHSGKPGGPWEANDFGAWGISTSVAKKRIVWLAQDHAIAVDALPKVWPFHPAARILRLVRRERHLAEEAAVVEAAMAWEHWANLPASECTPATFRNLRLAGDTLVATLRLQLSRCRPAHGIESRLATTESTFRCASTAAANCAALRAKRGG